MLERLGILEQTALAGTLGAQSQLRPTHARHKREINAELLLTALIDAFSILVIFLLASFSSSGELLFASKDMVLPKASRGEALERNPVVRIETSGLFLEDKPVEADALVPALLELKKRFADDSGTLVVQGDRHLKYEILNQIVTAAAAAGFGDVRFAVLAK